MAEAIVSIAIKKISDLLIHKAVNLGEVGNRVERLQAELKRMQCFLQDADRKEEEEQDNRLRNRVAEIRDLAYDAEDAIDSFLLETGGSQGFIKKFTSFFTNPFYVHKIGAQIKSIQTKLEDISKSLPAYQIPGEVEGSSSVSRIQQQQQQQRLRRTYSHVEELDVVSLEGITRDVLSQLMSEEEEDKMHVAVSIVGMGGIGKTTLAKKVYNHIDIKRHFDCLAWAFISQQCSTREVLHDILIKVHSPSKDERELLDKLKENQLIRRVYDVLKDKRYLIVLDDIWMIEDWNGLKPAFPRGKKGSKFLITTRKKDVALLAFPCGSPVELPLLKEDESWKLFSMTAFPGNKTKSHAYSKEFEMLGREMVKRCGGLPLAIVVLGGLLATKSSLAQWGMVQRNIHARSRKVQHQDHLYGAVNEILVLSYNDLPYYLKPCFLYIGHYPEDWEISKKELIRLWIAEGFISSSMESSEMLMEDVGEQFLKELANRCLVQIGKRYSTVTGVKTCLMHDLLRDLCMVKAGEENFFRVMHPPTDDNNVGSLDLTLTASMPRRIAIHPQKRYVSLKGKHPNLRSVLLCEDNNQWVDLNISKCKNFKFLRVLKLAKNDVDKWHVSSEIGTLHHLRYLGLNCMTKIILPRSIGKLKSMHTLRIRCSSFKVTADFLFELKHVRHILLPHPHIGVKSLFFLPPRFTSDSIETLRYVGVQNFIEKNAVLSLPNTRSLGIYFVRPKDVEPVLRALIQLRRLRSLRMRLFRDSYPDLEALSQFNHPSKLFLAGRLKDDLHPKHHVLEFVVPANIVKLTLEGSEMKQDPMAILEKLPHLRILRLRSRAYAGTKLMCSGDGFRQLDSLELETLPDIQVWEIEEGAFPCLRSLHLESLKNLRMFPEGLKYLTALQEMKINEMDDSFVKRIEVIDGREGDDLYKVAHIPSIQIREMSPDNARYMQL